MASVSPLIVNQFAPAAPTPRAACARVEAPRPAKVAPAAGAVAGMRIGIVCNPKAHRNRGAEYEAGVPGADVTVAAPPTREALGEVMAELAARAIDLLVIDGGDGTVRDVLTAAEDHFGRQWPRVIVIPSGKTNALAIDLGLPTGWTLEEALASVRTGAIVHRRPVEVGHAGDAGHAPLRGFLLGAGAFVDATELAQHTHRLGAFNGVAVGLALGGAIAQTLFGPKTSPWRAGTPMRLRLAGAEPETRARYLLLASTLGRLPLGLKPFGPAKRGLRLLAVDAPPKRLWIGAAAVVAGSEAAWLDRAGYHRRETTGFDVSLDKGFILDGELFPGGELTVRQGPKIAFVVP